MKYIFKFLCLSIVLTLSLLYPHQVESVQSPSAEELWEDFTTECELCVVSAGSETDLKIRENCGYLTIFAKNQNYDELPEDDPIKEFVDLEFQQCVVNTLDEMNKDAIIQEFQGNQTKLLEEINQFQVNQTKLLNDIKELQNKSSQENLLYFVMGLAAGALFLFIGIKVKK